MSITTYEAPCPLSKLPRRLHKCSVHKWRAINGIELIHEEPTFQEFQRIWNNWKLMTTEQKFISDIKSVELFSADNKTHYKQLYNLMKEKK